jgi:hypothetical protein
MMGPIAESYNQPSDSWIVKIPFSLDLFRSKVDGRALGLNCQNVEMALALWLPA